MLNYRVILYVAALILCVSAVWFGFSPDWRPALVFLGGLITFIKAESESRARSESTADQNDKQLLSALRTELPRQPVIDFFQKTDFLIDFSGGPVRTIEDFWRNWDNVDHEFFDTELGESRKHLLGAIHNCLTRIGMYAMLEENDLWRIRRMEDRHKEEFEKMWDEQAREIQGYADEIVRHYDDIIRRGRSRFPDPGV